MDELDDMPMAGAGGGSTGTASWNDTTALCVNCGGTNGQCRDQGRRGLPMAVDGASEYGMDERDKPRRIEWWGWMDVFPRHVRCIATCWPPSTLSPFALVPPALPPPPPLMSPSLRASLLCLLGPPSPSPSEVMVHMDSTQ